MQPEISQIDPSMVEEKGKRAEGLLAKAYRGLSLGCYF
jgi:hypothetical protein